MKHTKSQILLLSLLVFISCKKHTLRPYVFKGKILNELTGQPFDIPIKVSLLMQDLFEGEKHALSNDVLLNADGTFEFECTHLEKKASYYLHLKTEDCEPNAIKTFTSRDELFENNSKEYKVAPLSYVFVLFKPFIHDDPNIDYIQCSIDSYNQIKTSKRSIYTYNSIPDSNLYVEHFHADPYKETEFSYIIYYKDGTTSQDKIKRAFNKCVEFINVPF